MKVNAVRAEYYTVIIEDDLQVGENATERALAALSGERPPSGAIPS